MEPLEQRLQSAMIQFDSPNPFVYRNKTLEPNPCTKVVLRAPSVLSLPVPEKFEAPSIEWLADYDENRDEYLKVNDGQQWRVTHTTSWHDNRQNMHFRFKVKRNKLLHSYELSEKLMYQITRENGKKEFRMHKRVSKSIGGSSDHSKDRLELPRSTQFNSKSSRFLGAFPENQPWEILAWGDDRDGNERCKYLVLYRSATGSSPDRIDICSSSSKGLSDLAYRAIKKAIQDVGTTETKQWSGALRELPHDASDFIHPPQTYGLGDCLSDCEDVISRALCGCCFGLACCVTIICFPSVLEL